MSSKVVIVGAGFAGASTAFHLSREISEGIVVLEKEAVPGRHASGRNAGMMRQLAEDEAITRSTASSARVMHEPPSDLPCRPMDSRGSLLLASSSSSTSALVEIAAQEGVSTERLTAQEALERVPLLEGSPFQEALWTQTDGVIDIHDLLLSYLRAARERSVQVATARGVMGVEVRAGRVRAVRTPEGRLECDVLVNAAGAWAAEVGRLAGSEAPLVPHRRHLFLATRTLTVDPAWPFVWHLDRGWYFRPESGGLLLSACDQEPYPPGEPEVAPGAHELLAEKVEQDLPGLDEASLQKSWACLRTLSPDGRFVIGWDEKVEGLFWVAGLGGHGVSASWAVGQLASRLILEGPRASESAFDPARFSRAFCGDHRPAEGAP